MDHEEDYGRTCVQVGPKGIKGFDKLVPQLALWPRFRRRLRCVFKGHAMRPALMTPVPKAADQYGFMFICCVGCGKVLTIPCSHHVDEILS